MVTRSCDCRPEEESHRNSGFNKFRQLASTIRSSEPQGSLAVTVEEKCPEKIGWTDETVKEGEQQKQDGARQENNPLNLQQTGSEKEGNMETSGSHGRRGGMTSGKIERGFKGVGREESRDVELAAMELSVSGGPIKKRSPLKPSDAAFRSEMEGFRCTPAEALLLEPPDRGEEESPMKTEWTVNQDAKWKTVSTLPLPKLPDRVRCTAVLETTAEMAASQ